MCGIAGLIDGKLSPDEGRQLAASMAACIAHRGPDDSSVFSHESCSLAHNRLSIIDLSAEANQPMHYGDYVIVFNGEIYNYREIKSELIQAGLSFSTQSDTEVILAAYRHWGETCVQKFVGMWALAIWDKKQKTLFASRDRFGIKPFYYISEGSRFYFGSEYKSLRKSPLFSNELNVAQISRGLQLGWICYDDETYFAKVRSLPAAHNLIYKDGGISIGPYWNIETGKRCQLGFEEKKQMFHDLFADSINLHLRSDVTVASCLSGGLDSSAIVSMVQKLNPGTPYKSFSIYYDEKGDVDERPFIREVIKKYPEIEPHYYSPSEAEIEEAFHHALYHADVPATGSSFISQYFLMKLISGQKIRVVLDGQGSDEYLGGYMHTFYRIIADRLRQAQIGKAVRQTKDITELTGSSFYPHFGKSVLSALFNEQKLYSLEYRNYYPFLANAGRNAPFSLQEVAGNRTDNFLYNLVFNTSLPSLLHYEDRNSMAFSIESRVPFLDHRLVEFAFTLNTEDKVNGTVTKYILRKALDGIMPDAVTRRKDKKGFVTPGESKWMRGPLSGILEMSPESMPFLDRQKLSKLVSDYKKGDNRYAVLVWRLATLNYWIKNFV